jgi:hypothetical protein
MTTNRDDEDAAPDLAAMLAVAESEQRRTAEQLGPDESLIYGAWGLAWLVGAGSMWLSLGPRVVPEALAGSVFFVCIVSAMVFTVIHSMRRGSGVVGVSARTGAMYGWAWLLGFAAVAVIQWAAADAGASPELLRVLWTALSCLIVGVLYLAGGALWQDRTQYVCGIWILVVGAAGALFGSPGNLIVMSLGGGGGFLLAAAVARLRRRA